jgi:hypothetical protein
MKKLPDASDPLGWISYLFTLVIDEVTGKNPVSPNQTDIDKKNS